MAFGEEAGAAIEAEVEAEVFRGAAVADLIAAAGAADLTEAAAAADLTVAAEAADSVDEVKKKKNL